MEFSNWSLCIPGLLQHQKQQSIQISWWIYIRRKQLFLVHKGHQKGEDKKKNRQHKEKMKPSQRMPTQVGSHRPWVVDLKCKSCSEPRARHLSHSTCVQVSVLGEFKIKKSFKLFGFNCNYNCFKQLFKHYSSTGPWKPLGARCARRLSVFLAPKPLPLLHSFLRLHRGPSQSHREPKSFHWISGYDSCPYEINTNSGSKENGGSSMCLWFRQWNPK